ncbi:hypothetical protein [Mycolicibacterium sp.]|uniref:DUF7457 domain-containing protein n=1 Tax=Mycolicibacterium sp. TaxID=2320850 RepID=UPI00355EC950
MSALTEDTRQKIAACRALGLHYWCDAHEPAAVWAVDDNQQACFVVLDPRPDAQTYCGAADLDTLPLFDDDLTLLVDTA